MASDESGDASIPVSDELDDWLAERAAAHDVDREVLLDRLLATYRLAWSGENGDEASSLDDPDGDVIQRIETAVVESEELQDEFTDLRNEFMDLIEDVRSRVLQVKRETESKAPDEHDHPDVEGRLSAAESALDDLETDVADVDERVDAGFDNFEEILSYLTDTTMELEHRMDVLARSVVDARDVLRDLQGQAATRAETDALKRTAASEGVRTASCEECDTDVDVALLTEPKCPHCASPVSDVRAKSGLFGSHTLVTGDRPALTGRTETELDRSLEDIVDESASDEGQPDGDGIEWQQPETAEHGDR